MGQPVFINLNQGNKHPLEGELVTNGINSGTDQKYDTKT